MTKKRQPNWVIRNIKNIVLVISPLSLSAVADNDDGG